MVSARILAIGIVALLLIGCDRSYEVREIEGVKDQFCVPKSHIIDHAPMIPSGVPDGTGFAFVGCWGSDLRSEKNCLLPKVVGGVVEAADKFRGQRWQDFDEESLVKRTIQDADASFEVSDGGRTVVVSNKNSYWGWFIWEKAQRAANVMALEADDVLVAICQSKNMVAPEVSAPRPGVFCERKVLGEEYALSYSFESAGRIPLNVDELDAQLFAQVNRWRCPK